MPAQIVTVTSEDLNELKLKFAEIEKFILELKGAQNKWLRSKEARQLLGISAGALQNLRMNGTLPYSKVGGVLYYEYSDIQKVLSDNKTQRDVGKDQIL